MDEKSTTSGQQTKVEISSMSDEEEMSESEIAAMFGEKISKRKRKVPVEKHDIYAISARVGNATVSALGRNLAPEDRMVCNTFSIMLKDFYSFAEKMRKSKNREALLTLIAKQEPLAADLLAALHAKARVL